MQLKRLRHTNGELDFPTFVIIMCYKLRERHDEQCMRNVRSVLSEFFLHRGGLASNFPAMPVATPSADMIQQVQGAIGPRIRLLPRCVARGKAGVYNNLKHACMYASLHAVHLPDVHGPTRQAWTAPEAMLHL